MLVKGVFRTHSVVGVLTAALIASVGAAAVWSAERTIVIVGDSLSSGLGMRIEQSWVSKLEDRLKTEGYGYEVVNASISGDTTSGGLARLPRILELHQPAIVIIELGGNDGLRGQPVDNLRANLAAMIELTQSHGATTVLTGIQIPPNYGPSYTEALANTYPELASEFDIPLVGFLMEDVVLNAELMQSDGIHPNARGNDVMLENVWIVLMGLL
jgi:acyl-CoA thioesterase-1